MLQKGSKTFLLNYAVIDRSVVAFYVTALLSEREAAEHNIFIKFVNTQKGGTEGKKVS
jgi:hypothetical protein